eukprot:7637470-Heterocapsa_arctica.AAC.1
MAGRLGMLRPRRMQMTWRLGMRPRGMSRRANSKGMRLARRRVFRLAENTIRRASSWPTGRL